MRLSLIGMSGSGKTSWSIKLAQSGFKRFCCDDMIAQQLASDLTRPDGTTMPLGEWMGFPYEPAYESREAKYLSCEISVLENIIEVIENPETAAQNIVIDTTGSVIYTGEALLRRLSRLTTVVHLETPPEAQALMLKSYLQNKRPVLWRGLFEKKPEETIAMALTRCYATLLYSRERLYRQMSAVTIDYDFLNKNHVAARDFLHRIAVS
jgi:shikimate kinase